MYCSIKIRLINEVILYQSIQISQRHNLWQVPYICGQKRDDNCSHFNIGALVLEHEVTLFFLIQARIYDLKLYEVMKFWCLHNWHISENSTKF